MSAKLITSTEIFDSETILTKDRDDGKLFNWGDIMSKLKEPEREIAFQNRKTNTTRELVSEYLKISKDDIITI